MLKELNYPDAAAFLGLKETTFRKLCKEGKGPKARAEGRTQRFLEEHLTEWLNTYKASAYKAVSKPAAKGKKVAALLE